MQTTGRHGGDGPTARPVPVAELGHLDLDIAMEHVRELQGDHLRWMAGQVTGRYRYVRFLVRRTLFSQTSDRADPAR